MKRLVFSALVLVTSNAHAAAPDAGWTPLMDGKTMAGWQAAERPEAWVVEDGAFVTRGDRSHLFYVGPVANHEFKNFEFSAEVMTAPGSNSGIYVHTKLQGPGWPEAGYELQVINSNPVLAPGATNTYVEHKMTGSIYAVRNTWTAPAKDNEWFRYRIRVVGKTIQTFVNDVLTCEYAEPDAAFRAADKKGRVLGSGTFALQAHDPGSITRYRKLQVRLLPDDAAPPAGLMLIADRELDELIGQLSNDNIPLIDIGLVPPGGDGNEAFYAALRRFGMTAGSALPLAALSQYPTSLVIINDRERAPEVAWLQIAKSAGFKLAFSSGGATQVDEARLKLRLKAIKAAGLSWRDFWVPGKK